MINKKKNILKKYILAVAFIFVMLLPMFAFVGCSDDQPQKEADVIFSLNSESVLSRDSFVSGDHNFAMTLTDSYVEKIIQVNESEGLEKQTVIGIVDANSFPKKAVLNGDVKKDDLAQVILPSRTIVTKLIKGESLLELARSNVNYLVNDVEEKYNFTHFSYSAYFVYDKTQNLSNSINKASILDANTGEYVELKKDEYYLVAMNNDLANSKFSTVQTVRDYGNELDVFSKHVQEYGFSTVNRFVDKADIDAPIIATVVLLVIAGIIIIIVAIMFYVTKRKKTVVEKKNKQSGIKNEPKIDI